MYIKNKHFKYHNSFNLFMWLLVVAITIFFIDKFFTDRDMEFYFIVFLLSLAIICLLVMMILILIRKTPKGMDITNEHIEFQTIIRRNNIKIPLESITSVSYFDKGRYVLYSKDPINHWMTIPKNAYLISQFDPESIQQMNDFFKTHEVTRHVKIKKYKGPKKGLISRINHFMSMHG